MEIINLAPKFIEFYDQLDKSQDATTIYNQFKDYFSDDIYYTIITQRQEKKSVEFAAENLKSHLMYFDDIRVVFESYSKSIETILSRGKEVFNQYFEDYEVNSQIHTGHSLGSFDGATRINEGTEYLLFGFDLMARIYAGIRPDPFVIHELFHDYHNPKFEGLEGDNLLNPLWAEGLATYISQQVFPDATRQELILDIPPGLINKVEENIVSLVTALEAGLEESEPSEYTRFFAGPFNEINYRSGYYIGFLLAHYLSDKHTLQELVDLTASDLLEPTKDFLNLCREDFGKVTEVLLSNPI